MQKNKFLDIIKYNKDIQNKLNLDINDFKECSAIEIELILIPNIYGVFIKEINKEDESKYHVYFNNNHEEIKRNYITEEDKVKKINIRINYQVNSLNDLFYYCLCIESINFKIFYRNNIINMSGMFYGCSSLKEINFSNFITINVTDMSNMFFECSSLKEINLSNFNTEKVINMSGMFYNCSLLEELNLSNFNGDNVINMREMFYQCYSLKKINLSNFNTKNNIFLNDIFYECFSLKNVQLSNLKDDIDDFIIKIKNEIKNAKRKKNEGIYDNAFLQLNYI